MKCLKTNIIRNHLYRNKENILHQTIPTVKSFFKWTVISIILGLFMGLLGTAFHYSIESAAYLRESHWWIILTLPLGGIAIVFLYRGMGLKRDKGTNLVLLAVRENSKLSLRQLVCIFFATVITHLCGGSSGREGAALQIGGCVGAGSGRILRLDEDDCRIITMCGMSAGFAALFGTPVASAIFAMEVISIGILHYSAIVPCMFSAAVASFISGKFGVTGLSMNVIIPNTDFTEMGKTIILAVFCAVLSYVFCIVIKWTAYGYKRIFKNRYIRIAAGGVIVACITLLIGTQMYNGAGVPVILNAFNERAGAEEFVLKLLLTALTLGAGFKGGEIIPVFFVGSTFGSALSGIFGISPSFGASIGLIGLFCGVTNCPLTTLILSIELFGSQGLLFYGITIAVSYMLSGYTGLYSAQKIVYSKVKTKFINQKII